jgi:hypothetical protein
MVWADSGRVLPGRLGLGERIGDLLLDLTQVAV